MSTLTDRLAALKEGANESSRGDSKAATPLWAFLLIYTRAESLCYKHDMQGASDLYNYLAPLEFPELQGVDDKYHVPSLLCGYEMTKLAEIITQTAPPTAPAYRLAEIRRAERAILIAMYTQVIQELY